MNELERYNWGIDVAENSESVNYLQRIDDTNIYTSFTLNSTKEYNEYIQKLLNENLSMHIPQTKEKPYSGDIACNQYQSYAYQTAIYPEASKTIYPLIGLIGEVGEVAEKTRDYLFPKGCPKEYDTVSMFLKQIWHSLDDTANIGISAGKLSKVIRDKNKELDPYCIDALKYRVDALTSEQKEALGKEIGDIFWFQATSLGDMGILMGDVCVGNLDKLRQRKEEGKLGGSGDSR